MRVSIDLKGKIYGRLTVLKMIKSDSNVQKWKCLCVCGNTSIVFGSNLRRNHTKSCGCLHNDIIKKIFTTHGDVKTKEYRVWKHIRGRCLTKSDRAYHNYGGRGITICKRWNKYTNFLTDMGRAPSPEHSIDRIKNNKGYSPTNCRWATKLEQSRNRRNNILVKYKGNVKTLSEWCAELGLEYSMVRGRYHAGWTTNEMFS